MWKNRPWENKLSGEEQSRRRGSIWPRNSSITSPIKYVLAIERNLVEIPDPSDLGPNENGYYVTESPESPKEILDLDQSTSLGLCLMGRNLNQDHLETELIQNFKNMGAKEENSGGYDQ